MKSDREPFYLPLLASSGSWIAFSAAALFLVMLAMLFGPFEACGDPTPNLPPRVGVWRPASAGDDALRLERAWRDAAPAEVEWTASASLDALAAQPVDVVLVPHARRLDPVESAALGGYVARGGSAVVVGAIGVRDAFDTWLGWDAMRALLDVDEVVPLPREQSFFVAAGPRGPLTAGLAPGQRIALAAEAGAPALASDDAPLRWSTFALEPVGPVSAALLARQRGAGRLLWLAVGPEYAADGPSVQAFGALARAALAWAGRLPVAEIAAWPDGARFAALLAMDTEEAFGNATAVAEIAEREALPITFLALSDQALAHPEVTAALVRAGEVGSHADRHTGFEGQPEAEQRARLERSRRALESLGVPRVRGFRPPLLSYDRTTLETSAALHFDYVLGNNGFDRLTPSFAPDGNGDGPLVQVARVVRDDVDLIEREGVQAPEALASAALDDARRVAALGGLYYFSFHSHLLADPERIAALPLIGRGLREEGAWLARGGELADWWRARAGLSLEIERSGPHRVTLRVANEGPAAVERAFVRVYLARPVARASLRATDALRAVGEGWLAPAPRLHHEMGDDEVGVALPPLPAGARAAWHLDWSSALD